MYLAIAQKHRSSKSGFAIAYMRTLISPSDPLDIAGWARHFATEEKLVFPAVVFLLASEGELIAARPLASEVRRKVKELTAQHRQFMRFLLRRPAAPFPSRAADRFFLSELRRHAEAESALFVAAAFTDALRV
jgi:hypothetical protein